MRVLLPKAVVATLALLRERGFEAYVVGGSVRDLILKREVHDWDFTTNATPEDIQAVFADSFYENEFGTVGVTVGHLAEQLGANLDSDDKEAQEVLEITTYRSEGNYEDFRRPSQVTWGKTLDEDLKRRDFTMNAMALTLSDAELGRHLLQDYATWPEVIETEAQLTDPFNGLADLKNMLLKSVGSAQERFQEDALRMLRAVRLGAQLQLKLDQEIVIALQSQSQLIAHVSWERIRDEFLKILVTEYVEVALNLLYTTNILQHILPELVETRGVDQRGHHEYDVWTHSLRACQYCPSDDPVVRLAALIHDIAKPETQTPLANNPGEYSFFNHEVIGARTARDIARRLCLSKEDVQRVFVLVRWHMFYYQSDMTDAAIRRFIRRVGRENIDDILALREGDRLGSGSKRTSWRLEEMKERIHDQLHQPMQINEMAVDGTDVMQVLGVKPGPIIGQILSDLFEQVLENPESNTRENLLPQLENYRPYLADGKLPESKPQTSE